MWEILKIKKMNKNLPIEIKIPIKNIKMFKEINSKLLID
jgi:hypothetical protein